MSSLMNKRLYTILAMAILAGSAALAQTGPTDDVGQMAEVTLHIGKASLTTKIATTQAQEERGLMYRTHLGDNEAMLFILPTASVQEFWMKNCFIPLSVAYIDKDGMILEIHDMQPPKDLTVPDAQLPRYRSDSDKVAYALETNLHWFALNGIKPGAQITPPVRTLGSYSP